MKKLFLLLAGIFLITACEKEPNVAPKVEEESQLSALDRYLMRVAEEGIGMLGDTPTRAGARRVIDPARTRAFVKATTRSEEDTLFYVVNFADSTGFALVEADTSSRTPLIAVTEQGNYTPGEVTNTGFDDYIELLSQNSTREHILLPIDTTVLGRMYSELEEGPETIVGPLLEVEWGQHGPYNELCYNTQTLLPTNAGCVTTAIAQILSYYEYPTTLSLTHPYRGDLASITLDWDQIKYHQNNSMSIYGCWCADHTQLVHLYREIAERAGTIFNPSSPDENFGYTNWAVTPSVLNSLGYTSTVFYPYSWEPIIESLNQTKLVYCRGDNEDSSVDGVGAGHAWVVDGYHYQSRILRTYQEIYPGSPKRKFVRDDDYSIRYLHINWGDDGNGNGLFTPPNFLFDGDTYNYNLRMITDITPVTL